MENTPRVPHKRVHSPYKLPLARFLLRNVPHVELRDKTKEIRNSLSHQQRPSLSDAEATAFSGQPSCSGGSEGRYGCTEGDKGNAFPLDVQMGSSTSREY